MMKIIFLDIDGVLWTGKHEMYMSNHLDDASQRRNEFCPKAVDQLNRILSTDKLINIVISSSWRITNSLQWLKDHFESQSIDPNRVIGVTPYISKENRGFEIQRWLNSQSIMSNYYVDKFVIIDDDSDMGELMDHFVKTNFYSGLTKEIADKVIWRLNES